MTRVAAYARHAELYGDPRIVFETAVQDGLRPTSCSPSIGGSRGSTLASTGSYDGP